VVNKKKIKLSASQLQMFTACKRKWYYRYVEKIKEPYKPWLKAGLDFHQCIENCFKKLAGEEVEVEYFDNDIKEMVKVAWEKGIIYSPDTHVVEKKIDIDINEGAEMIGFIDLLDVSNSKIIDHKTFKRPQDCLTEDDLKNNLQLMIYAYWYLLKLDNKKGVWLRHNQINKIDPESSKYTEVWVSRETVEDYWAENVVPVVEEILDLQGAEKEKFTCTIARCGDYGGCSYQKHCEGYKYLTEQEGVDDEIMSIVQGNDRN
jgi:hypothetical protein